MRKYIVFALFFSFVVFGSTDLFDVNIGNENSLYCQIIDKDGKVIWKDSISQQAIDNGVFDFSLHSKKPLLKFPTDGYTIRILGENGKLIDEFDIHDSSDLGTIRLSREIDSDIDEPSEPTEPSEPMDDMAVGLTIHGADDTRFDGGIILGDASADPVGILDVRGDEARIWDGTASVDYATAVGDLYVEDALEVDGNIYGNAYRTSSGSNLLAASTGINVSEGSDGQWTITNSSPDRTVSVTGGTDISVSGTYPNFTINNTASSSDVDLTPGTGINISGSHPSFTITNSAPDQIVSLTDGTGIDVTGSYPNFNIANTAPDQTVSLTEATGIDITGSYPNFTIANSSPDRTVSLSGGTGISVSGSYPNFTINYTGAGDGDWTISGSNIYRNTGNIGIGTTSPSNLFQIRKNLRTDNQPDTVMHIIMNHTSNDDNGDALVVEIPAFGDGSVRAFNAITEIDDPHSFDGNALVRLLNVTDYSATGAAYGGYGYIYNVQRLSNSASAIGFYGVVNADSPYISGSSEHVIAGVRARITGQIDESSSLFHSAALYAEDDATGSGDHYAGYFDGNVFVSGHYLDSDGDAGTTGQVLTADATGTNWAAASGGDTDWTISGSDIYRSTGQVGIYATSPVSDLAINGNGSSLQNVYMEGAHTSNGATTLRVAQVGRPSSISYHVYGINATTDMGTSTGGYYHAIRGSSTRASASSGRAYGVEGRAGNASSGYNYALYGYLTGTNNGAAVYGTLTGDYSVPGRYAGYFRGNVYVSGTLSKAGGSFKIDHPMYPEEKYLTHSFVESPDMMNIYNGNITTDADGKAWIELPEYFEVLNKDFRYQLTTIGQRANAWIAEEIKENRFMLMTDKPNVKVSWQVTGIRQDPWAEENRIVPVEDKDEEMKGKYLNPELYENIDSE